MGCYGYICPICNTQIVGESRGYGEKCRLKHVRNGEVIGETIGHYGEYGNVVEDKVFRGNNTIDGKHNPNSHEELYDSEFGLENSYDSGNRRILPDGTIFSRDNFSFWDIPNNTKAMTILSHFKHSDVLKNNNDIKEQVNKLFDLAEKYKRREFKTLDEITNAEKSIEELISALPLGAKALFNDWTRELPIDNGESGLIAVHEKCWQSISEEEQNALPFSKPDPNQSCGQVRPEYT